MPRAGVPLPAWVRDAALVSAVALLVLLVPDRPGPEATGAGAAATTVVLGAVGCLVLLVRRRAPLPVVGVTTALAVVAVVLADGPTPVVLVPAVAAATAASRTERRTGVTAGAGAAVVLWLAVVAATPATWDGGAPLAAASWVALATAVGDAARSRRAYVEAVEERAERAERTREQEALRRVAEERLRIARELHDSVAHHIAVVNVQAGVAGHLLRSSPDAAAEALEHVRAASRTVLDELGGLLTVLRAPGEPVDTTPVAGTDRLPDLVRSAGTAGLHVEWRSTGAPRPLPPSVDLVAYRVVQEALTNARKHGDGTARLTVAWSDAALELELSNRAGPPPQGSGSGLGLLGMRERVTSVHGQLVAGPERDRFVVRATLPVTRPATVAAGVRP